MSFRRRVRILAAGKSPSTEMLKRTFNRAFLNGGVTQDFTANVENIREISRKLNYNVLDLSPILRKNLLNYSEEFDNVIWSKNDCILTANQSVNPFNSVVSADLLLQNGIDSSQPRRISQACNVTGIYTFSCYTKKKDFDGILMQTVTDGQGYGVYFNIVSGTFVANKGFIPVSSAIENVGNGWYRVSIVLSGNTTRVDIIITNGTASQSTPGTTSLGNYIWGAQLELGSITQYQQTQVNVFSPELKGASFVYVPASYGEGKNFAEVQNKRNLLTFTDDYTNAIWTKASTIITANAIVAPDGTLTADKIIPTNAVNSHYIAYSSASFKNTFLTFSVYLKAGENTVALLQLADIATEGITLTVNLITKVFSITQQGSGIVFNSGSGTVTDVGNGWLYCTVTGFRTSGGNATSAPVIFANDGSTAAGNNVNGLYAWGAQLELGRAATPYQKQVAAGDDIVDFNFTRATSATVTNKQGVIEDSCYNLFQFSEQFDNAIWTKTGTTVTANAIIAPDGNTTADKLVDTASGGLHYTNTSYGGILNTTYTMSVYMKAAEHIWGAIQLGSSSSAYFNLSTGVLGTVTSATATITPLPNGWYKCTLTANRDTNNHPIFVANGDLGISYAGVAGNGIYIWGAQLTQGSTPRPYLRTTNRLNVPRLDYSNTDLIRRNLLNYSEDYTNSYWTKDDTVSFTNNAAYSPINPTVKNALLMTIGGTTSINCRLSAINNVFNPSTSQLTLTVYLKQAEIGMEYCHIRFANGFGTGGDTGICVNLANGALTQGYFAGTTALGFPATYTSSMVNGWIFVTLTITSKAATTTGTVLFCLANGATDTTCIGATGKGMYLSSPQLVQGTTALTYQRTTIGPDSLAIEPTLLTEKASTNLLLQSEDLTNASWTLLNITVASGQTDPNGRTTAFKIAADATGGTHRLNAGTGTVVANATYISSIYAKVSNVTTMGATLNAGGNLLITDFNLSTGLVTTTPVAGAGFSSGSSYMQHVGNGWYRCVLIGTIIGTPGFVSVDYYIGATGGFLGNGQGTFVWHPQLEQGTIQTTYIPTTTTTVVRNAETNYVDLFNNSALNRTNWTLFYEGYLYEGIATTPQLCLSDSTTAATNTNQIGWIGALQPFYNISNARTNGNASTTNNTFNRFAITQNNGIVNFYLNGFKTFINKAVASFDYRYLVLNSGGSTFTTDKLILFNRTLNDTECFTLTDNPVISNVPEFIATWDTTLGGGISGSSGGNQIKLPLVSNGTYNFRVDWGDGSTSDIAIYNQAETTHTYLATGTYTIKIKGLCVGFGFANLGDRNKIKVVQQWGCLRLGPTAGLQFQNCANLDLRTTTDGLDLTGTTNLSSGFAMNNNPLLTSIANVDKWNTSTVTNMSSMFGGDTVFNSAIGTWDVSKVTNMNSMFSSAWGFNNGGSSNINNWNVSNVTDMAFMFYNCGINQPMGSWNVSKVTTMDSMFGRPAASFSMNQNFNGWAPTSCTNFNAMFSGTAGPFNNGAAAGVASTMTWTLNTTSNINMSNMFNNNPSFNANLSGWNVTKVTAFGGMFYGCSVWNNGLAQGVAGTLPWVTSSATNFDQTFRNCSNFNQDVSSFVMTNVTAAPGMFTACIRFNNGGASGIGSWNMGNCTNFGNPSTSNNYGMFQQCTIFNQNLTSWNVSKGTSFMTMFNSAIAFNNGFASGVSHSMPWVFTSTGTITTYGMFWTASAFNGDISTWNVNRMNQTWQMFNSCPKLNQVVNSWVFDVSCDMKGMFNGCTIFNNGQASGVGTNMTWTFNVSPNRMDDTFQSCPAFNQNVDTWNITGCPSFVATFNAATVFNNGQASGVVTTMPWTINSTTATTMASMFQACSAFNQDITAWNMTKVNSIAAMFFNAVKFNQPIGVWDVSSVTNMSQTFLQASLFNQPLNAWNVSNVTNMAQMFEATPFNQDLSSWNVTKVTSMGNMFRSNNVFNNGLASGIAGVLPWITTANTSMGSMFQNATAFNQDVSSFDTSKVTSMSIAFYGCTNFNNGGNPNINNWNTSLVTNMNQMFNIAHGFNQPIGSWDVSKVTDMNAMINVSSFNQNIGNWSPVLVISFPNFMQSKTAANFSAVNLDAIYNGWTVKLLKPTNTITFGSAKYTAAASDSRALLTRANVSKVITNAVNNGSGLIRITSTTHGLVTNNKCFISAVTGTTEANGLKIVTVIDANTFDIQGSAFVNTYISGGAIQTGYGWTITDGGLMDVDAGNFVVAANITDAIQSNGLETFVLAMKSNALWTKMKVIYPMIGGTSFSHKWNLKDPRDLDVAFRISFAGTQTHDAQGATCTSGSNTFFKPSEIPNSVNDYHISYYTGSNTLYPDIAGYFTIGAPQGGNDTYNLIVNRTNFACVSWLGAIVSFATPSVTGLVSGTRLGTAHKVFLNGVLKTSAVQGSAANVSTNTNTFLFGGANAKCQYASISPALTDAEVLTHYNLIQAFQTTLGRQV